MVKIVIYKNRKYKKIECEWFSFDGEHLSYFIGRNDEKRYCIMNPELILVGVSIDSAKQVEEFFETKKGG
jgi:hypothetical protein